MKILILGAGKVGGTLAEQLANEAFDITVVDVDGSRVDELAARLDIRTVTGWASHPDVLRDAGAEDAEVLIAVTGSDEVNMVACQVCYSLFGTPRKIARVRSPAYLNNDDFVLKEPSPDDDSTPADQEHSEDEGFFSNKHFPIDEIINPEQVVTEQIQQLLENPGALEVLDFADGRVKLVAVRAVAGSPLVGKALRRVREQLPNVSTRVAAIFRRGQAVTPTGDTVIEADDEVFFIVEAEHINAVMAGLRDMVPAFKSITIAGGGQIGERLALAIEPYFTVKLLELNERRCEELSQSLNRALVLRGDATDRSLLTEENIDQSDAFCAVTDNEEVNIVSSLLARQLGVRRVMALVGKQAYADLVQDDEVDIAISPQQATTSSLLTHIRRGDVTRVHRLRRGAAEAMEAVAHGDEKESRVVGRRVKEIGLPPGTTIGAIVRGDQVLVSLEDEVVRSEDHVILFLTDKSHIAKVGRLFEVKVTFF